LRRSAFALLIGLLLLTSLRVEAPTAHAGDNAHATLTAARTHAAPAVPVIGLLTVAVGLAVVRRWRSLGATNHAWARVTAPLPIRRRGPPFIQS
jgi:hypothetical protein